MDAPPPAYTDSTPLADEKHGDPTAGESQGVTGDPPPPTYDATNSNPPEYSNEPPPSYDSLILGPVQKAKDESSGNVDFAKRLFCMVCCGTIAVVITLVVSLVVPMASLVIGTIYLHDCPRERYVPIFLIVSGVFGLLKFLSSLICHCKESIAKRNRCEEDGDSEEEQKKANPFDGIVGCFLFAWTIAGSVWVYRIHKDYQSTDPSADDYCNETVYLFAFWLLTIGYILMCFFICCGCCCAALGAMVASKSGNRQS